MKDQTSTNAELIEENNLLQRRIRELEHAKAGQKHIEEQLEQLTDAMEAAKDGIAILNAKEEYVYLNKAHANIYGYDHAGELIGKSWRILYGSDELQRFEQEIMPDFRQKGHWQGEAIGRKADGKKFPQELSLTALDSGGLICVVRDITERKRMEEELEREQAQLFSIFDQMSAEVTVLDPHTYEILFVNRYVRELYGQNTVGRFCYDVFHGCDAPCRPCNNELLLGKNDDEFIQREVFSEPIGRHYLTTNNLIRWPDGRRVKLEISIDTTDKKQAEEALRQSRDIAERLAEEMAIIAEIGRVVGSTLDLNQVFERVTTETRKLIPFDRFLVNLKKTPDGQFVAAYVTGTDNPRRRVGDWYPSQGSATGVVMKTRTGILIQPTDAEEIKGLYPNLYETFKTGLRSTMSVPLIAMDEVIGSMNFRSEQLKAYTEKDLRLAERIGMQVAGAIANAQLFTDLQQVEKTLRESEEKFRLLIENAPDAIYVHADARFVYLNHAAVNLFGAETADQLIGSPIMDRYDADYHGMIAKRLHGLYQERKKIPIVEQVCLRLDGSLVPVEAHAVPITYGDKDAALTFVRDITERKRAEEEKRSLEERLNRAEKMEALGTLAGGVAHDLNNVLGVVVGYSEMLLDRVDKSSPLRHGFENVMSGGLKAAAIVDDLLTLARRGVPSRNIFNLNKIIADNQKSPEYTNLSFHHPLVKIKTDLDPDLLNISGSSVHLGKTLYNLVSNASEAMAKGGVVTIKTANQYLEKPIHGYDRIRPGDYVVLSVSDTGEGIHEADLKRIFEPFYTKKVMGRSGTGLGLAVVWGTVKDHHGYINVQSEEGKGSTFTLYFPVTREGITAEAVAVAISEYMGNGESILVVDDVKEQCDLAADMLRKLNYRVTGVSSGEEAVAYRKDHPVDLMVLDMIMDPGMDGLDTYRSVLELHPGQKAIIVSGFSESDRVSAAQGLGAGAYVKKPYVMEKLGLAVRKELDRPAR